MLYFLVGPMGVGKNFVGQQLAAKLGCPFVDGDEFIPPAMLEKVKAFKRLGKNDIDNFVVNHLIPGVRSRYVPGKDLIVAQALYRKEHRDVIREKLVECSFVLIKTSLIKNLRRLLSREHGIRWAVYGLLNRPFFQEDDIHIVIEN